MRLWLKSFLFVLKLEKNIEKPKPQMTFGAFITVNKATMKRRSTVMTHVSGRTLPLAEGQMTSVTVIILT